MKKLLITLLVLVLAAALLFGLYYFLWRTLAFAFVIISFFKIH